MYACEKCKDKGFTWKKWTSSEPPAHWEGDEYKVCCDCPVGKGLEASAWAEQFK